MGIAASLLSTWSITLRMAAGFVILLLFSCGNNSEGGKLNAVPKGESPTAQSELSSSLHTVTVTGAMRNVMWKGELGPVISLDSLRNKGSYGIGPLSGLRGEILLSNGIPYVSFIDEEGTPRVEKRPDATAPFLVRTSQVTWDQHKLPNTEINHKYIEHYLNKLATKYDEPFAFRILGNATAADIHVQNLAPGSIVSSPTEAHAGQVNLQVPPGAVEILGFYSRKHQGIFTHHDSNVHMHLITEDKKMMGHLDSFVGWDVELLLPAGLFGACENCAYYP